MKPEMDTPENRLTKYQELYTLAKEIFQEELNRSANIEQKAAIYISILTFLLGLLGFFGEKIISTLLPPKDIFCWVLLLLLATLLCLAVRTWFYLFQIVRIYKYSKMPIPLEFFHEHDLSTVYYVMAKGLKKNLSINRDNTNRKADALDSAYALLRAMVIVIAITFVTFTIRIWTENSIKPPSKEIVMPDDPQETSTTPNTTSELQNTPEVDVEPPAFVMVTNSRNDARDERTEIIVETKDD